MIARLAGLVLLLTLALPAQADTKAVYRAAGGITLTVETAKGNVRTSMEGEARYSLILGGAGYIVTPQPGGVIVDRAEDLTAVMAERGKLPESGARGLPVGSFFQRGTATIHDRTGTAWFMKIGDTTSPKPFWVISNDPALAELGPAMLAHFNLGLSMAAPGSMSPVMIDRFRAVLRTGAPLVFSILLELTSVSHDPIPADRFALPAPPETRDQLRARLASTAR